jgi:hypothetical protein
LDTERRFDLGAFGTPGPQVVLELHHKLLEVGE